MTGKIHNLGVAIEPIAETEKKVGMIIIPNSVDVKVKQQKGIVRAVGKGTPDRPMEVSVGQQVVYKTGEYPKSGKYDVVRLDDILWIFL